MGLNIIITVPVYFGFPALLLSFGKSDVIIIFGRAQDVWYLVFIGGLKRQNIQRSNGTILNNIKGGGLSSRERVKILFRIYAVYNKNSKLNLNYCTNSKP